MPTIIRKALIAAAAMAALTVEANRAASAVQEAAKKLGAGPSDIPGLWWLPDGREVTRDELIQLASEQS